MNVRSRSAVANREAPLRHYDDNGLADYIASARYTRMRSATKRRETFAEAVARVETMHQRFFGERFDRIVGAGAADSPAEPADLVLLREELGNRSVREIVSAAFAAVAAKRVLPSMRSLQFGGEPILRNHARLFNCAFSPADRLEFFREYFYLLLAGTGCGFSVQRHHVARLPPVPPPTPAAARTVSRHRVGAGATEWADALHLLLRSRLEGKRIELEYATGQSALREAFIDAEEILDRAIGRRLRPIEIYDLCMALSRAVLAGGSRRAASLCLFSPDDEEMVNAKTGSWLEQRPQRAASTLSAVLVRTSASEADFRRLLEVQREFGEPGFYFTASADYGCNPCGEIGLHPVIAAPLAAAEAERLEAAGYSSEFPPEASVSGWQLCNLSTINGAAALTAGAFFRACVHAAVIGTLQAAYTDIPYLGPVTRYLNERDALLGVSICGIMDNPDLLLAPRILERGARICRATNQSLAAALGIRSAARVTCVKPEGTAALLLGAAPGIHPHPARHYFRRVRADRRDPVYRQFHAANPDMTEPSLAYPDTEDVIVFPVEAPERAVTRAEIGAVEFLRRVLLVQRHWVLAGEAAGGPSPGLHHNVSHTCAVRPAEWREVADFIWRHRAEFSGVALLGDDATARYPQPPLQPVETDADVARWNKLGYHRVDYSRVAGADTGRPSDDPSCEGAVCEA